VCDNSENKRLQTTIPVPADLVGAGSGSTAENKTMLPVRSSKRDDHRDQQAKSITTRSMCDSVPKECNSGSGRGLRSQVS
jgi:hypothetical protein